MDLIKNLSKTPITNKRFSLYYKSNSVSFRYNITDFLNLDFRYQQGVFLDYLRTENIGLSFYHKGYIAYVLDNELLDKTIPDWVFTQSDDGLLIIDCQEIKPQHSNVSIKDLYIEVAKKAIFDMFWIINKSKTGFSINAK